MESKKPAPGICDTTLRDGEQMPGVVFSFDEKVDLAQRISDFGADTIEVMPAVSDSERRLASCLSSMGLSSEITASTMLRKEHIDMALDCGVESITLFAPLSDLHLRHKLCISREENLDRALSMVDYARSHGLKIAFAGEDSSRADPEYLISFMNELSRYIEYFIPCDTLGCLTPMDTYRLIQELKERGGCRINLHVHNDYGLATANTLAGLCAGAEIFSGTFGGIGERAGNAPIEEVCVALKFLHGTDLDVRYEELTEICGLVEKYSKVELQSHKPIVGRNAFTHESGIHVDGVLKNPLTYENFEPAFVGQQRRLLFGKHTGRSIINYIKKKYLIGIETDTILEDLKALSENMHRSLTEPEIVDLLRMYSKVEVASESNNKSAACTVQH